MLSDPQRAQRGAANKGLIIFLVIVAVIGFVFWKSTAGAYNTFVENDETVQQQWAALDSQYKRRADLIPQLVSTVKGAAGFEQETFTAVTEARAKATSIQFDKAPTDQAELNEFMAAQGQVGRSLGRLLVSMENYPELRATEAFLDLQGQIEGTENRINVARGDYIAAVKKHNTDLRTFPNNIIAGFTSFEPLPQLQEQSSVDVRETPEIEFGDG